MKTCGACKKSKTYEEFARASRNKDGYSWECKACKAEDYRQNRERRLKSTAESKNRRAQKCREYVATWFQNHPCVDCGQSDIRVLEFDHVRGIKVAGVGYLASNICSLDMVKEEIDKCEVRCKNCHAIKTYERLGGSWHDLFLQQV